MATKYHTVKTAKKIEDEVNFVAMMAIGSRTCYTPEVERQIDRLMGIENPVTDFNEPEIEEENWMYTSEPTQEELAAIEKEMNHAK